MDAPSTSTGLVVGNHASTTDDAQLERNSLMGSLTQLRCNEELKTLINSKLLQLDQIQVNNDQSKIRVFLDLVNNMVNSRPIDHVSDETTMCYIDVVNTTFATFFETG
jgi:hypothetical protein